MWAVLEQFQILVAIINVRNSETMPRYSTFLTSWILPCKSFNYFSLNKSWIIESFFHLADSGTFPPADGVTLSRNSSWGERRTWKSEKKPTHLNLFFKLREILRGKLGYVRDLGMMLRFSLRKILFHSKSPPSSPLRFYVRFWKGEKIRSDCCCGFWEMTVRICTWCCKNVWKKRKEKKNIQVGCGGSIPRTHSLPYFFGLIQSDHFLLLHYDTKNLPSWFWNAMYSRKKEEGRGNKPQTAPWDKYYGKKNRVLPLLATRRRRRRRRRRRLWVAT